MRWYLVRNNYPATFRGFLDLMGVVDDPKPVYNNKPNNSPDVQFTETAQDSPTDYQNDQNFAQNTNNVPNQFNSNADNHYATSNANTQQGGWDEIDRDYNPFPQQGGVTGNSGPPLPNRDYGQMNVGPSLPSRDYPR